MESLYSIGLGLGLRFLIDTATKYHGLRVDGILIGLWEGVVLNHFARQYPSSFDPYIAFVFRMLIDFLLTRNFSRMTVVILWTGLGMVLSDVFPDVNRDKRFRRMTRPFRRWFRDPNVDFLDYLPSLPSLSELADFFNPPRSRPRGRPSSSSRPTASRHAVSRTNSTTTRARSPVGESFVLTSRRHLPGNYTSETETTATNTNLTSAMSTPNPIMPPLRGILTPSRQSSIISPSPKPPSILNSSRPPTSILSPPQSTAFFPPNSSLSSPTREAPPQLQRSGIVSPPRSILSTPRSILSPPRQNTNNPPIIQQPSPRHPPPTSIISPPLSAPSPSIPSPLPPAQLPLSPPHNSPPGGRESDFEYADIPYNHVPQDTVRPPRRFPQEVRSPPLIADPPHNLESMPMPMPQPEPVPAYTRDLDQGRPRPLSDIPEATQSQEASQVSRLSHISHLSSRISQALSNLPPPSEHTTEGDEREYQSGLDSSQFDELDAFTTPPYLAKGSVIDDDDPINDPLMTPPGNTAARNMTGVGSGFGDTDRRGEPDPLPQHQYLPFGAFDDKQRPSGPRDLSGRGQPGQEARDVVSRSDTPSSKGDGADKPTPATKHKRTESSARPSMIPVRGSSVWGGSNLGISEPAVRPPPPSSVGGGGSVWGDSTKDEESATIRVRDPPAPKSNRGSIWGSLWGGSAKDEGSVRDDASVREDIPVEPIRRDTRESRDRSVKAESVKAPRSVREPSAVRSTVSKVPSVRDDKSAIDSAVGERKRESPQPLSRQPTGNGSARGASVLGSVKDETKPSTDVPLPQPSRSIRGGQSELGAGGDNASVAGKTTKSALDDGKSVKERAAPLEDVDGQKKLNKDIESGAPPTPAKSTASISASASLWSEKPRLPELPPLQSPETPTIPADAITKNIVGLKGEEATKAVMDAWDQAVKTRAPELKILVGLDKAGTTLRRKITKSLEKEHGATPAKINVGEVIFRLPDIPPAISN